MGQSGLWYDGKIGLERLVDVVPDPPAIRLTDGAGVSHVVQATDLVRLESRSGQVRLAHRIEDGWRLILEPPLEPEIAALLPSRTGSLAPRIGKWKMGALMGVSIIATLIAGAVIFTPHLLAERMPMSWERKLGAAYDFPIESARCEGKDSRAALEALMDRVDPQARRDGFTLELVDFDTANAVALPGGRMVLFDGLLREIDNPDALAGILLHEIAHLRRRHVAAGVVRELGLGTVVTLMGGGVVASNAGGLMSLNFSREAEAEADADSIALMRSRVIDPRPTAKLFAKLSRNAGESNSAAMEFLESHPASASRAKRFAGSFDARTEYRPALHPAQWRSLRSACADDDNQVD